MSADAQQSHATEREIIIKPAQGWIPLDLRELWDYRELLFYMTWRDITVRYKQTLMGATWAILQPVANMVLFSIIFGRLAKMDSEGLPYPLFSYSAVLPWAFFSGGLSRSSGSLVGNSNLIKKVYFPRLVVPLSAVITGLPDFGLAFLVVIGMMIYYGIYPASLVVLLLPFFLLLAAITALGVGLWFSAMNVIYRDTRYIISFLLRFWMYATPVVYSSKVLDEPWRTLYAVNPMVGVIEGFRWALLGQGDPPGFMLFVSTVAALVILISGAYYFRRMEKIFADLS
ncbi:MAG: ABC transporter permease [Anaerolineae bacterium]|nr:ABC transporter permease [Anaerolineae bacterium]